MEDRIQRMKELVSVLREAGKAYYQESRENIFVFIHNSLIQTAKVISNRCAPNTITTN